MSEQGQRKGLSDCRWMGAWSSAWHTAAPKLWVSLLMAAAAWTPAFAAYNANMVGTVTDVLTYPNGLVYFRLANQPGSNGPCAGYYFELDSPNLPGSDFVNDAAFNRVYARLAQAYAMGEAVNIGFDNVGSCGCGGYIRAYRVG